MSNSDIAAALKMVPQGAETVFPKAEYDRKIAALREQMATRGFDLFMTSGPENVFYLTGQQTPGYYTFQCLCIPQTGEPFHVLRGLEIHERTAQHVLVRYRRLCGQHRSGGGVGGRCKGGAGRASAWRLTATVGS
jgi:hypothetical protein